MFVGKASPRQALSGVYGAFGDASSIVASTVAGGVGTTLGRIGGGIGRMGHDAFWHPARSAFRGMRSHPRSAAIGGGIALGGIGIEAWHARHSRHMQQQDYF